MRFLVFLLAAVVACAGCARKTENGAARVLRISQRNEPADLDPALAALPDDFFIIRALGEGLLSPSPTGGPPEPAAAQSWTISADELTYTFHLRRDLKWSNGAPLTAQDFVDSYRRLLTPATAAPKAALFFMVRNAEAFAQGSITDFSHVGFHADDAHTLVVTLAKPMAHFPWYVASGSWIPSNPRVVAQFGRGWTSPQHFVGNGPFVLKEWRPHQRIVIARNPLYARANEVKLDEIQFIAFDNGDTEERAFRAGQIDVTMSVPTNKLEVYAREHPEELHRAPLAETRFLSFNTQRTPLNDIRVRRALSLAIDRAALVEHVTLGGQLPAVRLIPPPLLDPSTTSDPVPAPDYAKARELLAEAGFTDGKNFPALELSAWSPSQTPVLEAIQAMWRKELGLGVKVTMHEAKVHLASLVDGSYDIAFTTTTPMIDVADPVALLENFVSDAPNNFPHWDSPEFDRDVAHLSSIEATDRNLRAIEQRLLDDAVVAPIYFNVHNWLMTTKVRGWREDPLWTRFYLNLTTHEN